MTGVFAFDEANHKYYVDGREIPSVSRVLQFAGVLPNYAAIAQAVVEVARDRGNIVHELIHKHHTDGSSLRAVDEKSDGCLRAYEDFLKVTKYEPIYTEERLYSEVWEYAGTIDSVGWLWSERVLIDLKTTSVIHQEAVELQTAAYLALHVENHSTPIQKRLVLHLKKNGRWSLVPCVDEMAFDRFVWALDEMRKDVNNENRGY